MAPFVSDDEASDSETAGSVYDAPQRFHRPETEHDRIPAQSRHVTIILKDAHDFDGPGMKILLRWTRTFKNIFGHFKARSCGICRAPDEMRFKTDTRPVTENDTPQSVCSHSPPCC